MSITMAEKLSSEQQTRLVKFLRNSFSEDGLNDICLPLGIDPLDLGQGPAQKSRGLVLWANKHNKEAELFKAILEFREDVDLTPYGYSSDRSSPKEGISPIHPLKENTFTGASLLIHIDSPITSILTPINKVIRLELKVAVTSDNGVSSKEGALKLTITKPLTFSHSTEYYTFSSAEFNKSTGLKLKGYDDVPHGESLMTRWGTSKGIVIFSGNWHDFFGNSILVDTPSHLLNPTYLMMAELFNVGSSTKQFLFSIQQKLGTDLFEVDEITEANYWSTVESFWETYKLAYNI